MATPQRRVPSTGQEPYDESLLTVDQADVMALIYGRHLSFSDAAHYLAIDVARVHELINAAQDRLLGETGA